MENHPIPQDVTGFQFKLIGSMTVKQFGLLAVPVVLAFLFYYLPFPFFIKYPLIFLFGITGLTLAFVPIEGRPADVMIKHFIEAFFAPNQYVYQKEGRAIAFTTINLQKIQQQSTTTPHRDNTKDLQLQTYLQNTHVDNNPLDAKETAFLQVLQKYSPAPPPSVVPPHQSSPFALPIHLPKFNLGKNSDVVLPPSPQPQPPVPEKQAEEKHAVQPLQPIVTVAPHPVIPLSTPTHAQLPPVPPVQAAPIMPTPFTKPVAPVQQVAPVAVATPPRPQIHQQEYTPTWAQPEAHPQIAMPPPLPKTQVAPLSKEAQEEVAAQLKKMREEKVLLEREVERLRAQAAAAKTPTPAVHVPPPPPLQVNVQPIQTVHPAPQPPKSTNPIIASPPPLPHPIPASAAALHPQSQQMQSVPAPVLSSAQMAPATPHVSKIPKDMARSLGLPTIPDSPNLITGLIRDPRGNVLANMLVEVKDKEGNPVRAFKTNQLGQFASATPLMNGTYTITFEDPADKQKFDTIEIHAKGEIIAPISIVSHDAREELRKALFN